MSNQTEQQCRSAYDAESPDFRGDYRAFRNGYYAALHSARQPLTYEQILEIELLQDGSSMTDFARAIERAHGIVKEGGAA